MYSLDPATWPSSKIMIKDQEGLALAVRLSNDMVGLVLDPQNETLGELEIEKLIVVGSWQLIEEGWEVVYE